MLCGNSCVGGERISKAQDDICFSLSDLCCGIYVLYVLRNVCTRVICGCWIIWRRAKYYFSGVFVDTFCISYLFFWMDCCISKKKWKNSIWKKRIREIVVILIAGCILIANKGTLKESTSYECYTYIESGQADDYKAQMEERLSLLRNPELKNVELPAMNSDQGPLMHMEVMEDPKEWTNKRKCYRSSQKWKVKIINCKDISEKWDKPKKRSQDA